jgi:hypothetical protein
MSDLKIPSHTESFSKHSSLSQENKEFIQTKIKDNLGNSASQGLIKIFKSKYIIIKCIWFLSLLLAMGISSYLVIETVLDYLDFGVTTKIRTIQEIPYFPTVTICSKNKFSTDYSLQYLKDLINKHQFADLFSKSNQKIPGKVNFFESVLSSVNLNSMNNQEKQKLGFSMQNNLIDCGFNHVACFPTDFRWSFDKTYGNCYTFNSGYNSTGHALELKQSIHSGQEFGLSLTLFNGLPKGLKPLYTNLGIIVRINNQSYSVSNNDGISVSPGFETNLAIDDRIYSYLLPKPYSNCDIDAENPTSNSKFYNLFIEKGVTYSQETCIDTCFQEQFVSNCNCTTSSLLSLYNVSDCEKPDEIKCLDKTRTTLLANGYSDTYCYPNCPLECKRVKYSTSISTSRLLSDLFVSNVVNNPTYYSSFTNNTINESELVNYLIKLNIYYGSLTYTVITESAAINLVSLLSNIGGTLSLFLGISVLSIIEIFEVVIEIIIVVFIGSKNNSKVIQVKSIN